MRIRAVPIRDILADKAGLVSSIWHNWLNSIIIRLNSGDGVSGTFTTADAKTVTVVDGIIVNITP